MQLTISNNLNFYSRCKVIRNADDIARKVSSEYITLSVTKLYNMPNMKEHINNIIQIGEKKALYKGCFSEIKLNIEKLYTENKIPEHKYKSLLKSLSVISSLLKLDKKLAIARKEMVESEFDSSLTPKDKIKKYLSLAKKYRMGNCGECTDVAIILGHNNKLHDMHEASVYTKDDKSLDHTVLYVDNNGKPYIIDAWLGFADFLNNTIQKYRTIYSHHFIKGDIEIKKEKYSVMCNIISKC